jgi:hypothetical protein
VKLPKAKPKAQIFGHEIPWLLVLDNHNVKLPKAKDEGASHFIHYPKQSLQSYGQDIVSFFLNNEKKIDGLLTIVWVSIHVRP